MEAHVVPEQVLNSRGSQGVKEALIKWKNLQESEPTWEEAVVIRAHFPDFYLEDKVDFLGRGIDTYKDLI